MRCILACPDDFLWRLVADSGEPRLDPLYLVESARARTRIVQRGGEALTGDLEREGLYRRAFRTGHEPVLLAVERARQARIVAAIRRDALAMVDAQPSFFEETFERVDLVIDHHPEEAPVRAILKDLRPGYGATATILTEYLRAIDARVSQRLATALLYGIKADTQHLERGATRADLEAFAYVHALANHSALRRIERPDLPNEALDVLARGVAGRHVVHGVVFSHLGAVAYPELVAQFADFFLQVEGAEWSVVSGTVHGELHVSVRNVGWVRAAGDVVRHAFGDLGSAGGHRAMAKAVIRLRDWRAREGDASPEALARTIVARFTRALRT